MTAAKREQRGEHSATALVNRIEQLFSNSRASRHIQQLQKDSNDKYSMYLFLQVIAAEGEQKASRALRQAADVIAESSSALQVQKYILCRHSILLSGY